MSMPHRLIGIAVVMAALAAAPGPVHAAATVPIASFAASPRFQAASAASGEPATFLIDVRNFNERAPLPVSFELADLDERGWITAPHTTPYSLVGLATLPEPMTFGPGETKRVAVVVKSDGRTHYGSVVVVAGPPGAPFARIALKIVITAPDAAAEPDIQVTPASSGTIKLDLRNTGDGLLSLRGVIFLLSPDNRFLGRLDVPLVAILPHGSASITLQWPEKLPSGTIARTVLTQEGRKPFVVNATVP